MFKKIYIKNQRGIIVGRRIKAGRGQERRFTTDVRPKCLHTVAGKIIVNSNENMLGAYYAMSFIRCRVMKDYIRKTILKTTTENSPMLNHLYLQSHQPY